jgi:hypothetical protein
MPGHESLANVLDDDKWVNWGDIRREYREALVLAANCREARETARLTIQSRNTLGPPAHEHLENISRHVHKPVLVAQRMGWRPPVRNVRMFSSGGAVDAPPPLGAFGQSGVEVPQHVHLLK